MKNWLGVNIYDIFASEFAYGGKKTPAKIVDALKADKENIYTFDLVSGGGKMYVIENMQSGELAKGIEEALEDIAVVPKGLIFTNFPGSLNRVESIPDVLAYNKNLLLG